MQRSVDDSILAELRKVAAQTRGLSLLVLFGSRARGDCLPDADWDFGYLADEPVDLLALMAELSQVVGSDRLDVVDLGRASGLLRYRVARDGVPAYETAPGLFNRFRFEAARFWFDAEPVLRPGYKAVLDRLG